MKVNKIIMSETNQFQNMQIQNAGIVPILGCEDAFARTLWNELGDVKEQVRKLEDSNADLRKKLEELEEEDPYADLRKKLELKDKFVQKLWDERNSLRKQMEDMKDMKILNADLLMKLKLKDIFLQKLWDDRNSLKEQVENLKLRKC